MKKSISKKLRFIIAAILIAILIASGIMFFRVLNKKETREESITIAEYNNKAGVSYQVHLKPNPLYNTGILQEDMLYLTSFVDKIKLNFNYAFSSDKGLEIKGSYHILAIVEGFTNEEEGKTKTIWSKEFVLQPKEDFQSKDKLFTIEKEIMFSIEEYNSFASQINELTKLNIPVKASVVMLVDLKAFDGKNIIDKQFAPSVLIPLNNNFFQIFKSGVEDKPETIEETKQVQLPVNSKLVTIFGVVAGLAFIALLYLLIFVKGDAKVDLLKKQLDKIFKNHGSRLVAINNEIGTTFAMYFKVKSIEDLVRIADELGKPIMYKYSQDPKEISNFYVHDDKAKYTFNIKDSIPIEEEEAVLIESRPISKNTEIPIE